MRRTVLTSPSIPTYFSLSTKHQFHNDIWRPLPSWVPEASNVSKAPAPTPNCTHNCGPIEQAGVDWRHWTCRCGYGYYTPEGVWISGFDVRNGLQPPRDQQRAGDR